VKRPKRTPGSRVAEIIESRSPAGMILLRAGITCAREGFILFDPWPENSSCGVNGLFGHTEIKWFFSKNPLKAMNASFVPTARSG